MYANFKISLIGSLFIAAVLIVLSRYRESSNPYLLIINYNQSGEEPLKDHMKKIGSYKLKSKTVTPENTELTIEIRTDNDHQIVSDIQKINGVKDCVLVSYNGDYVS